MDGMNKSIDYCPRSLNGRHVIFPFDGMTNTKPPKPTCHYCGHILDIPNKQNTIEKFRNGQT